MEITVNNQAIEIGDDERLNCIQAASRIGYEIPAYCWHEALSVVASCRMCLVEVGEKKPDGTIVMQPKLVPGCQTPVKEGTIIVADSPKVKAARQATLEYLLLNHPLDCPTCDQAGECFLQDYSFRHGRGYSRLQEPKNIKPDKDHIGDQITLFTDRCIMCTRCVRFTKEISGSSELQIIHRGTNEEIDVFPGRPCNNKLAGNVVDLCPVGALCSKDFLYKQRVWWLKSSKSVCPDCSTGCSIYVDQNEEKVYRLHPRTNPQAQGHFMCDEGRFGWKYLQSEDRLRAAERLEDGQAVARGWHEVLPALKSAFSKVASVGGSVAGVFSPWMTIEEAYLLAVYLRSVSPHAVLGMGPIEIVGEDDHYPKDVHGRPPSEAKFTIRAEKCPNRRGVESVLQHFSDDIPSFDELLTQIDSSQFDAVYLVGGAPRGWISEAQAASLSKVGLIAVQDIFPSPASSRATFVLPGGSFAEREGTFVNHAGLAQGIQRAVRGPGDARVDGRILWELNERPGLFRAATVRKEMASVIPAFAALSEGKIDDGGNLLFDSTESATGRI